MRPDTVSAVLDLGAGGEIVFTYTPDGGTTVTTKCEAHPEGHTLELKAIGPLLQKLQDAGCESIEDALMALEVMNRTYQIIKGKEEAAAAKVVNDTLRKVVGRTNDIIVENLIKVESDLKVAQSKIEELTKELAAKNSPSPFETPGQ